MSQFRALRKFVEKTVRINMTRIQTLSLLGISLLITICSQASAEHRQVFLLGGQSNMEAGGNPYLFPPLAVPLPEVRLYYTSSLITASVPQDTWVDLQSRTGNNGFGPELPFGHALNNTDPGGNYALIKRARGGSDVYEDWNPEVDNNVYADFRNTVDAALQALSDAGDTYEIVGMLWTQGIRDGREGRNAT